MSQSSKVRLNTGALQIEGVDSLRAQATAVADAAALTGADPGTQDVTATVNQGTVNGVVNAVGDEVAALVVDVADIHAQLNDLLAKLRTHGLIAT